MDKEELKKEIAITIGKLEVGQLTLNGIKGQVVLEAKSLINLLEEILKQLK